MTLQDQLAAEIDRGGRAYVRNSALAEAAVLRGQFNLAKVFRALAHAERIQAMTAARRVVQDAEPAAALPMILAELENEPPDLGVEAAGVVRAQALKLARRAQASLAQYSDVAESDVAQSLWGCYGCGYLAEGDRPEVCPVCGALEAEFEWFGPFYSHTPEHLGQLTPAAIVTILEAGLETAAAIAGLDEGQLRRQSSPEDWCIAEIVGHMIETEQLFLRRARTLLAASDVPNIDTAVPPWKLQEGQGYEALTGADLIQRLRQTRADTVLLVRSLRPEDWARAGTIRGVTTTMLDLGTWLANHDRGHLAQVVRLAGLGGTDGRGSS
jgi:rubrerythrin